MYLPEHPAEAGHRFVSTGSLPPGSGVDALLGEALRRFAEVRDGRLSGVYPALAAADPASFGICLTSVDGTVRSVGDTATGFTLMSVSKPFVFALAVDAVGLARVRTLVGVNATGLPFNSAQAVERTADGRTNPMVNAGAIATASLFAGQGWDALASGLSRFAGRPLAMDSATLASAPRPTSATGRWPCCSASRTPWSATRSRPSISTPGSAAWR